MVYCWCMCRLEELSSLGAASSYLTSSSHHLSTYPLQSAEDRRLSSHGLSSSFSLHHPAEDRRLSFPLQPPAGPPQYHNAYPALQPTHRPGLMYPATLDAVYPTAELPAAGGAGASPCRPGISRTLPGVSRPALVDDASAIDTAPLLPYDRLVRTSDSYPTINIIHSCSVEMTVHEP